MPARMSAGDVARSFVLVLVLVACGADRSTTASSAAVPAPSASSRSASTASGSASPAPASASAAPEAPFACFSWAHLDQFSTDCYRGRAACEAERESMIRGARPATPCGDHAKASCTILTDASDASSPPRERCFGDAGRCEHYRAFIARGIAKDRLRTTACAER